MAKNNQDLYDIFVGGGGKEGMQALASMLGTWGKSGADGIGAITENRQMAVAGLEQYIGTLPQELQGILRMPIANKGTGGGNAATLEQEFLGLGGKGNTSGSAAQHARRMAGDLARYGVNSLSELKAVSVPMPGAKGGQTVSVFYNTRTGNIVPTSFGSSMKGEGGSNYKLRNVNGQVVPESIWRDTSDKGAIMGGLAVLGAGLGAGALFGGLGGSTGLLSAGGAAAEGAGAAGGLASAGAAGGATGLASLPAAGTWAQTALPALGAGAGAWTSPAALAGVSGITQAGGLTLGNALGGTGYQGGTFGTTGGAPSGAASSPWDTYSQTPTSSPGGTGSASNTSGATSPSGTGLPGTGTGSSLGSLLNTGIGAAGDIYNMLNPPQYPDVPNLDAAFDKQQEAARANALWQLEQNRVDQSTPFANRSWDRDPTTGEWKQTTTLNSADQGILDQLRGKESGIIGGMGQGFNVQGDVMNAYKALQAPQLEQQRNRENARLAAMGLGTGSGQAWGYSQDALNRSENEAGQQAILAGFNADQQLRQSNRADLGALQSQYGQFQNSMNMPTFPLAALPETPNYMQGSQQQYTNQVNQANARRATQEANVGGLISAGTGLANQVGQWTGWW
jgi:hypothetical protein